MMKRTYLIFIVAAFVVASVALWFFSVKTKFQPYDLLQFGVILILVAFAIFIGFKRLGSAKRGEPPEDEMSKKVMQRTAALSFYISIYLWLAIMYFSDRIKLESHSLIGAGILGMAVVFAVCWLVIHFGGVKND